VNRIRTIATAGIVAGSVAFAAALLSSGGVGASFVDAAEAGASITVANSFEGPAPAEPTPSCTVASDRAGITFTTSGESDTPTGSIDLERIADTDANQATIAFTIAVPNDADVLATWKVADADDLTYIAVPDSTSQPATLTAGEPRNVSVTFSWPDPSDQEQSVRGSATITVTCVPEDSAAQGTDVGVPTPPMSPAAYMLRVSIDLPAASALQQPETLVDQQ
jgi:hypothetical protein